MLSAILNLDSLYSYICNIIKVNPNKIVKENPSIASLNELRAIPLCTQVTAKPEINKISVFNEG